MRDCARSVGEHVSRGPAVKSFKFPSLLFVLFFLSFLSVAQTTTTLTKETSNNTSACGAANSPSYCAAAMPSMISSGSGTYNLAPGNVSSMNIHSMLYPGSSTKVFAYFEPWFCMTPGSGFAGSGSMCTGHIQVGYNSNDVATVHGQIDDMKSRGFDGLVIDSYGANLNFYDSVTQKVRDDLNARCSGTACPLTFALMEDDGSFKWTQCPRDGGGVDQTACITTAIENDLDDMNAKYFTAPAYLKVDKVTKQPSADGRPVVFYFFCEECFVNPVPNWGQIWGNVRAHVQPYAHGNGLFIFRNAPGFTHTESDGAFAWVNRYGTDSSDPYGLAYLDNFYDTSVTGSNSSLLTWGAAWKGFDETNAAWKPTPPRVYGQQCGNTWIQTFNQITNNANYGTSNQLPFFGVVTWNDYEEGTEVETGIDNCVSSLNATVVGSTLSWNPTFSSTAGSESTISGYIVYDSTDGQNLTSKSTLASGTHSINLSTLNLSQGNHTLFVQAVGLPSIQNHMSDPVAYSVGTAQPNASVSPTTLSFSTRLVNTTSGSQTVTLRNTGTAPLNIASIATSGNFSQTNSCGTSLAASGSCSIFVKFTPTAAGTRTGTLTVNDNAAGSPQTVSLMGTGTIVALSTTSLVFPTTRTGTTSAAQTITVWNRGSVRLNVSSVSMSGSSFLQSNNCVSASTGIAPGSNCSISVRFKPTGKGSKAGTLSIFDDGGASPQKVSLSGTGS
ncbi:MAG: hypothetical protein JWO13_1334 [Acidobacteriales bacterium]|nr:hypothetical protein [Terriglobales bacterium]